MMSSPRATTATIIDEAARELDLERGLAHRRDAR
jgi:hypothetical protein